MRTTVSKATARALRIVRRIRPVLLLFAAAGLLGSIWLGIGYKPCSGGGPNCKPDNFDTWLIGEFVVVMVAVLCAMLWKTDSWSSRALGFFGVLFVFATLYGRGTWAPRVLDVPVMSAGELAYVRALTFVAVQVLAIGTIGWFIDRFGWEPPVPRALGRWLRRYDPPKESQDAVD